MSKKSDKSISNGYIAIPIKDENSNLAYPSRLKKSKTLLAYVFFLFCVVSNDVVLAWIHERVPTTEPLPDLWFSIFPEVPGAIIFCEILMLAVAFIAIACCAVHSQRWVALRRLALITGLCFFIRAICIALIQVPVPSKRTFCGPKVMPMTSGVLVERVVGTVTRLGMNLYKERHLCGDLIVSGHTITFTISWLLTREYGPKAFHRWLPKLIWLMGAMGIVCMLLARKHYTVDILLAYALTTRIFWMYHSLLKEKNLMVGETFWRPLFNYFESDVDT